MANLVELLQRFLHVLFDSRFPFAFVPLVHDVGTAKCVGKWLTNHDYAYLHNYDEQLLPAAFDDWQSKLDGRTQVGKTDCILLGCAQCRFFSWIVCLICDLQFMVWIIW